MISVAERADTLARKLMTDVVGNLPVVLFQALREELTDAFELLDVEVREEYGG